MKTYKISFEVDVPDNITDGMLGLKFCESQQEIEIYNHLEPELEVEDEVIVRNVNIIDIDETF